MDGHDARSAEPTQGADFENACLMAAEWPSPAIGDMVARGKQLPEPTFGNIPRHGGRNLGTAVMAETEAWSA